MQIDFNRILFVHSYACNMNCPYCMHSWHKAQLKKFPMANFDLEHSKQLLDLLLKNTLSSRVQITFSGGEPLVFFDSYIVPMVLYIREKEKQLNIKIIIDIFTNGTLLTENIFKFFKLNSVQIGVSYDGHHGQEYRDLKTREIVEKNIKLGLEIMPELISCASTFYKDSFSEMYDAYKSISQLGVRQWSFAIDTLVDFQYSLEESKKIGDQIQLIYNESKINPCNVMTFEKIKNFHNYIETNKAIIARPNGDICVGTTVPIMIPEKYFSYFTIGKWTIDEEKLKKYQEILGNFHIHVMGKNTPNFCKTCLVFKDCQSVQTTRAEREIRDVANVMHCLLYLFTSHILNETWN